MNSSRNPYECSATPWICTNVDSNTETGNELSKIYRPTLGSEIVCKFTREIGLIVLRSRTRCVHEDYARREYRCVCFGTDGRPATDRERDSRVQPFGAVSRVFVQIRAAPVCPARISRARPAPHAHYNFQPSRQVGMLLSSWLPTFRRDFATLITPR